MAIHTPVHSQVQDKTVAGIIVPKVVSTQSQYCFKGTCGTGGTPHIPANYTKSTAKLPVLLISLSNTCEILNKNNLKGCPPISELMVYDTSNKMASGKFVIHDGLYSRTQPQMKNNWLAYSYSKNTIICVECYFDVTATEKSRQIIIQPNSFTYVNKTETESKNTWYNFDNRYMQGCDIATIANIPGLLQDTINFMLHNCTANSTSFKGVTNHTRTLHPFTFDNPYSSLVMASHYKTILQGHYLFSNKTSGGIGPSDCIRHTCDLTTSNKKW